MEVKVGEYYPWILFESVIISIDLWITGMLITLLRRKYFNKEFYEKYFHEYKQFNDVMSIDSGYPDDGQGRLAQFLDHRQWFIFNNYRRSHLNYLQVFHCLFLIKSIRLFL
jgi:hypothetical protein